MDSGEERERVVDFHLKTIYTSYCNVHLGGGCLTKVPNTERWLESGNSSNRDSLHEDTQTSTDSCMSSCTNSLVLWSAVLDDLWQ